MKRVLMRIFLGSLIIFLMAPLALSVTLEWDAPTTNVNGTPLQDLKQYNVYIDGAYRDSVAAPSPSPILGDTGTWTGVTKDGSHDAYVTAEDLSGHESGPSNVVNFDTDASPSAPAGCRIK